MGHKKEGDMIELVTWKNDIAFWFGQNTKMCPKCTPLLDCKVEVCDARQCYGLEAPNLVWHLEAGSGVVDAFFIFIDFIMFFWKFVFVPNFDIIKKKKKFTKNKFVTNKTEKLQQTKKSENRREDWTKSIQKNSKKLKKQKTKNNHKTKIKKKKNLDNWSKRRNRFNNNSNNIVRHKSNTNFNLTTKVLLIAVIVVIVVPQVIPLCSWCSILSHVIVERNCNCSNSVVVCCHHFNQNLFRFWQK